MFLIENIKAWKSRCVETHAVEYEVTVDAHVVGELSYGPYYFTVWELGNKGKGVQRRLCLKIQERVPSEEEKSALAAKGSPRPLSHWPQIASELIPLASLFLRRRLILGSIVRHRDKPQMYSLSPAGFIDDAVVSGETNLEELSQWLPLLEGLDPSKQEPFVLAVKFYHEALQLIEEKPDLAYLNLVSAIETLCQDFDIGKVKLADVDEGLAKLIKSISDDNLRTELEEAILNREHFHRRKFVRFIERNTDQSFWDNPNRPTQGRINPSDFPKLLTRIYDQRSETLHSGEPFPVYVFFPPLTGGEEIPSFTSIRDAKRVWEPKDYIPNPHFFERLVNHVLKNYLKAHQIAENF